MSDMADVKVEVPEDWNNVDIVVEEPDTTTREDLLKQIEEAKATIVQQNEELENSKKPDPTETITKGFEVLNKNLNQQRQSTPPQKPKEEEVDLDALGQDFFNDPVKSGKQLMDVYQGKKIKSLQKSIVQTQLNVSKMNALQNEKYKYVFDEYGSEVDEIVRSLTPEQIAAMPDVYERAAQMVAGKHMEKLRERAISDYIETQKKETPFTEVSTVAPQNGKNGRKKVKITPQIQEEMNRAAIMGLDPKEMLRLKYGG